VKASRKIRCESCDDTEFRAYQEVGGHTVLVCKGCGKETRIPSSDISWIGKSW
jgi:RNase P subunit RPR2